MTTGTMRMINTSAVVPTKISSGSEQLQQQTHKHKYTAQTLPT